MPEPDPVESLARDIAAKHVARSMEELHDPAKVEQWVDGPRADEFAAAELEAALGEIVDGEVAEKPKPEGE